MQTRLARAAHLRRRCLRLSTLAAAAATAAAGWSSEFSIDLASTIKNGVPKGAASANVCWLTDSDTAWTRPIPTAQALAELGVGSLRFPYGHLADNYLWHTPPFENTGGGLRPKVATPTEAPGQWSWAVDPEDGSFRTDMDFDEYMSLCQKLGAKPLVVVNVLSQAYEGGPSPEYLIDSAVEWVRYAKRKNYHVEYWQIGNEVDHHADIFDQRQYVAFYGRIASAMKQADPAIRVGPGVLRRPEYFLGVLEKYPDLIDFVSSHQYQHGVQKSINDYASWKESSHTFDNGVELMQQAIVRSSRPDMELLVTETGVTPANDTLGRVNNAWKALWWFETLMNQVIKRNASYSYFWGVHTPWDGPQQNPDKDVGVLLTNDNQLTPIGEVTRFVNQHLLERMVAIEPSNGYVRAYATASASGDLMNVFLLNKNDQPQAVTLSLANDAERLRTFAVRALAGETWDDRSLTFLPVTQLSESDGSMQIELPPLSLTIIAEIPLREK